MVDCYLADGRLSFVFATERLHRRCQHPACGTGIGEEIGKAWKVGLKYMILEIGLIVDIDHGF